MNYFHPERTELIEESDYIETLTAIRERLAPYLLTERFASFDGTQLVWEGYLAENARGAVVILHGFTEFPGKYLEMTWYFLNRGYHVFLPTQRGHDSGGVIHVDHFDDYVQDLHCLIGRIRKYTGVLPVYLYAHSMGGAVGARHLEEYPGELARAVLTAPMLCPRASDVPYPIALGGAGLLLCRGGKKTSPLFRSTFNPNAAVEHSSASSEARFRWNMKCRLENPSFQTAGATNRWVYEALAQRRRVLRRKDCRKICVPVLVFCAGRDSQVRQDVQRRFVDRVTDARLVVYPEEKHELFSTKNEVFREYLSQIFRFLEE